MASGDDIMKIIYFANFDNTNSDNTEQHIKYALEQLGHSVVLVNENKFTDGEILNIKDPDIFLFHKAGVGRTIDTEHFVKLLTYITCAKVCWYFDAIDPIRENYIEDIAGYIDLCFLTDDTWRRRHKYDQFHFLPQGIGNEDTTLGTFRKEYECDVCFAGGLYSEERVEFAQILKQIYGDKFKIVNNVFNRDLYDLCASAKIMVAPPYPMNDFYWSSRFYMTLGSGGFLVHPDLYGLRDEFTEGKHFAGYGKGELVDTIDYYLKHEEERKVIQAQGRKRCLKIATYKDRIKTMLEIYEKTTNN